MGLGSPLCEWPIILPKRGELRVSLCPLGKAPLGDNHPGREVEVVIRVFKGDQASSENSGHSGLRALPVSSSLESCGPSVGGGGERQTSKPGPAWVQPGEGGLLNRVLLRASFLQETSQLPAWSWVPRGLVSPPASH